MQSKRAEVIPPFYVMEILEKAHELEREGERIIHLEVGEPDFETPQRIKEAAQTALLKGNTRYTHSQGIPELREAISWHYEKTYGVHINPSNITVTNGTSLAMVLLFTALLDPGDELIVTNPCYACYPNILEFLGNCPRYIPVREEDSFKLPLGKLGGNMGEKTKGLLINSPSNPTGVVLSKKDLKELVDVIQEQIYIISDEIYHGLTYEEKAHSILEFTDRCFVLNGFSKLYAMTGWRLGYLICPPDFTRAIQKIHQNINICANSFVQMAGIAALKETKKETEKMVKVFDERRKFMIPRLREIGFGISHEPTGAFYVFANARKFTSDSKAFAFEVLENTGVAVTPGIDFGSEGEGYIRFSYANSIENISEGLERLENYLRRKY
ncbi:MAG: pyridoxal phosphate-dependent aminotransferase [Actinomycetota bacterium]|nr:pyridoxal phosphate-dependent aminotransferase [Actinomycetota bacterium]